MRLDLYRLSAFRPHTRTLFGVSCRDSLDSGSGWRLAAIREHAW